MLVSDNEGKLRSVIDLLEEKLVRRKVPLKALQYGKVEAALGGTVRQHVAVAHGISDEKARERSTSSCASSPRSCGCRSRVTPCASSRPSKDELQGAMQALRDHDFGIPLQFTNYR